MSPFDNFTTSFQNSFVLDSDRDTFLVSTNEHHIYLHLRNANWLAREIDNVPNNNQVFDCTFICSGTPASQISGNETLCTSSVFSVPSGATSYTWSITEGNYLVSQSGNGLPTITLTNKNTGSGYATLVVTYGNTTCGNITVTKRIWVGAPQITGFVCTTDSSLCTGTFCQNGYGQGLPSFDLMNTVEANSIGLTATQMIDQTNWEWERINTNIVIAQGNQGNLIYVAANNVGQTGVRVRAKNNCGWSEWIPLYFEIVNCNVNYSRLLEQDKAFIVYPNPSNDLVNIDVKEGNTTLKVHSKVSGELFDMMGNSKAKIKIKNNKASFNVNVLNKGIYVLQIDIDVQIESHQIQVR